MERRFPRRSKVLMGVSWLLLAITVLLALMGIREIGIMVGLAGMMCLILAITESWG